MAKLQHSRPEGPEGAKIRRQFGVSRKQLGSRSTVQRVERGEGKREATVAYLHKLHGKLVEARPKQASEGSFSAALAKLSQLIKSAEDDIDPMEFNARLGIERDPIASMSEPFMYELAALIRSAAEKEGATDDEARDVALLGRFSALNAAKTLRAIHRLQAYKELGNYLKGAQVSPATLSQDLPPPWLLELSRADAMWWHFGNSIAVAAGSPMRTFIVQAIVIGYVTATTRRAVFKVPEPVGRAGWQEIREEAQGLASAADHGDGVLEIAGWPATVRVATCIVDVICVRTVAPDSIAQVLWNAAGQGILYALAEERLSTQAPHTPP